MTYRQKLEKMNLELKELINEKINNRKRDINSWTINSIKDNEIPFSKCSEWFISLHEIEDIMRGCEYD